MYKHYWKNFKQNAHRRAGAKYEHIIQKNDSFVIVFFFPPFFRQLTKANAIVLYTLYFAKEETKNTSQEFNNKDENYYIQYSIFMELYLSNF